MYHLLEASLGANRSQKEKRITSKVLEAEEALALRNEMWNIYTRYYQVDRSTFFDRFSTNDYYAIYEKGNSIIGFTAFRIRSIQVGGKTYRTFYLGQTVLQKEFRGQSLILKTCVQLFVKNFLQDPFTPIYVWCDALTYKPYLLFANALQDFYPSRKAATPTKIAALLKQIGAHCYPESFDLQSGTIRKHTNVIDDISAVITKPHLQHPDIRFFVKKNPQHQAGHGLIILAPINLINFISILKRLVVKKMNQRQSKYNFKHALKASYDCPIQVGER